MSKQVVHEEQTPEHYLIVSNSGHNPVTVLRTLEDEVNCNYLLGWEALGGVSVTNFNNGAYVLSQAMIRSYSQNIQVG